MGHYGDIQFDVHKGIRNEVHWHSEMELLFVISGTLGVVTGEREVMLGESDLLLINSGIRHSVVGEDTMFCLVKYPWRLLSEMIDGGSRVFICNSAEDREHSYGSLRNIFRELIMQYVRPERRTDCLIDSLLLRLLNELIEQFSVEMGQGELLSNEMRLQHIIQCVNHGYQHNLSLSKLAEEIKVSTSTLSRFFKKQTGYYFVDYVNQVRVQAAMEELEATEENITKIAVNCGFSNLTVFNRVFRDINGCSPTEYRRLSREKLEADTKRQHQVTEELRTQLRLRAGTEETPGAALRRSITVSAQTGERYKKPWITTVNIGSASQLTQSNLQAHTLYLRDQIGFQYVRVWNVFARRLMITDGQRVRECSFDLLDDVLDFLVKNHISPYLDLGKRPNTITRNESEVVFQEYETIDFSSRRVWEHAVLSFIRHVVKRYGRDEVSGWIFELTWLPSGNASDLLYHVGEEGFHFADAFQFLHRYVREYAPGARVGCAGAAMDFGSWPQRQMLSELVERGCPPDFFSTVVYPYESINTDRMRERAGRGDDSQTHPEDRSWWWLMARRSRLNDWEERQVAQARTILEEVGLKDCSLYICEWNCTLSNRNFLNDSCYRSAALMGKVASIWNQVDMLAICMGSDWVDNHYDTIRVVNGNMGLIGQRNIRKPIFFAMQFLGSLGEYVIHRQEHCIITRTNHGSFYILCFNQKALGPKYYDMEENRPLPSQLDELYADHEPLELELVLTDMPEDVRYTVKRRSINDREGSILPEWGRFRYDDQLEESDVRYLRDTSFPRMSMERLVVREGRLCIRELLQPNEVSMLHIYQHNVIQ